MKHGFIELLRVTGSIPMLRSRKKPVTYTLMAITNMAASDKEAYVGCDLVLSVRNERSEDSEITVHVTRLHSYSWFDFIHEQPYIFDGYDLAGSHMLFTIELCPKRSDNGSIGTLTERKRR